ncbi:MAG TPA: AAA family ATPase [Candidatus Limnocylindria bacterium]|nr:AAA family ATPase [Candidatus Limnocylindria bacterium]
MVVTYDSVSVAEARAVIAHGIERRVPLITLTGRLGAGTTAVLRSLVERFVDHCDLALPAAPPAGVADLAVPVLRLLGRPFIDAPVSELLATLGEALDRRAASPRPLALLLDDAESLPDDVLEALAVFGPPDGSDRARLPVVLAGRPGLVARLSSGRLAPLRHGLTIDVRLHTPQPAVSPPEEAAPVPVLRRTARPRTLLLAVLTACLCGATALYLEQPMATFPPEHLPPPAPLRRERPSALAPLLVSPATPAAAPGPAPVPPPAPVPAPAAAPAPAAVPALALAPAPGSPRPPAASEPDMESARRVVAAFQEAVAAGDGETIRSLLAADVRYNGVVGVDAALDDQIWLGRGPERPRFLPPDTAERSDGSVRVESTFTVPFRDVAGKPGEVRGRAVWRVARRGGLLQIVAVDYDVLPGSSAKAPGG